MAWKIEKWFEEVFPGKKQIYTEYNKLPPRELIITCAASLDLALVQLISLRLLENAKEIENFLGIDGNGRAPCATFGSRIQLSLLLGIITIEDANILRLIKKLRNLYAHTVKVSLMEGKGYKLICELLELYNNLLIRIMPKYKKTLTETPFDDLLTEFSKNEDSSCAIINVIFAIYQAYFHNIFVKIIRIKELDFSNNGKMMI